jgi:hypothetical protein
MKNLTIISLLSILILAACGSVSETDDSGQVMDKVDPVKDSSMVEVDENLAEDMDDDIDFDLSAGLLAVDGSEASGLALATYDQKSAYYNLKATFANLVDAPEGYFYEGWVVQTGVTPSVISVGKIAKEGEKYVNRYVSETDLSDHGSYVLTLEPDDGDPAPAAHVVEGDFKEAMNQGGDVVDVSV